MMRAVCPRGARWIPVDLHLHVRWDRMFKYIGDNNSNYVGASSKAGINVRAQEQAV